MLIFGLLINEVNVIILYMVAINFDTLKYSKQLEEAGVPRAQAEAQVRIQQQSLSEALDEFVVKNDFGNLKKDVDIYKSDIVAIKTDLSSVKNDVAVLKTDVAVLKLMMGVMSAGIMALVIKAFFG
jgi:hypothetical protein